MIMKNPSLPSVRRNPSACVGCRNPHAREGSFDSWKIGWRPVFKRPSVRCRTPLSERRELAVMRTGRQTGRNYPRQPRHAFSRRTARISALSARRAPTAARRRRNPRFPSALKPYVPGAVPASGRLEPLSVRLCRRSREAVRLRADGARTVPKQNLGARTRPYRPVRRSASVVLIGNRFEITGFHECRNSREDLRRKKKASGTLRELRKNQCGHDGERLGSMWIFNRRNDARPRIGRSARTLGPCARPYPQSRPYYRRFGRFGYR